MSAMEPAVMTPRPALAGPTAASTADLDELIGRVCAKIAPTWPLDRFIAVNPFWGLVDTPLSEVAANLQGLSGAQLLMPRAWYRRAFEDGRLREEHLRAALETSGSGLTVADLRALLERDEPKVSPRPQVMDVVDAGRDLVHEMSWRTFLSHSISQFCAAYFDDGQAQVGPSREGGLYASWLRHAQGDRSPAILMRATLPREWVRDLPTSPRDLVAAALTALEIPRDERENYLWSLLLDQNGWASWCAYRGWQARLEGGTDETLAELLSIRLAWEWLLSRSGGAELAPRWRVAMARWPQVDAAAATARQHDWLLQTAMEIAWRAPLLRALPSGFRTERPSRPSAQAIFCIDVRSEPFRRALESTSTSVQTGGFAGFFGVPLEYQPRGAPTARPQLPGLLAPRLRASDTGLGSDAQRRRTSHLDVAAAWRSFKTDALSTFSFVEGLGLTYAAQLLADSLGRSASPGVESAGIPDDVHAGRKPRLVSTAGGEPLELEARCALAAGILKGMSLTHDFARLVLLVGHGSETRNNPHAAGLECGACGGQSGEVNARVAAALLNEPEVRAGLSQRGITVPDSTWFVPGLHNTTVDEVRLFDLDELPPSHVEDANELRARLEEAGARARKERAAALGLGETAPSKLHQAIRARSTDWAQVRPEWGLVNNAALIVAPREHCRHVDLQGRAFLHEYRHAEDQDFGVLELIMTAPMVVTHWINFQYYASTVDNLRYGSGNKVLHNVVGGHLGVFEGNGGDLRIGLPLQSLHDGERWVHEPLRLSVFIEAPRSAIDAVLSKHATVRALVTNGWISLFQLDESEGAIYARRGGAWHREAGKTGERGC